jgi:hypothetical protein
VFLDFNGTSIGYRLFGAFAPSLCIMHQIETPHIPHIKHPHCDGQRG